jgi:hypothetical protein
MRQDKEREEESISNVIKPPLGLTPKWVRDKERFDEICAALSRYYNAGKKIPIEWVEEYNSLVEGVVGQSEQFICPECKEQKDKWIDKCEDCTLKEFG